MGRGPAKYQMIKPMIGNMTTSRIHNTFVPVSAEEFKIDTIAHMSRANTISPPIEFNMHAPLKVP